VYYNNELECHINIITYTVWTDCLCLTFPLFYSICLMDIDGRMEKARQRIYTDIHHIMQSLNHYHSVLVFACKLLHAQRSLLIC
jgi:hypothetical protein